MKTAELYSKWWINIDIEIENVSTTLLEPSDFNSLSHNERNFLEANLHLAVFLSR